MRKPRDDQPNRVCHIISRIAHRAFFLNDEERDRFVDLLRRAADFSGVDLLSWCVMTNHVHVLVFVGARREIPDEEILRRMRVLYRPARFDELRREWDRLAAHPKSASFRRFRESFLKRMWNASTFMQTLKQHFTMSFNERREHTGTMWEGRCHMRVHRPDAFGMGGEAMLTAGYIDANPAKAGIVPSVERAGDSPWGSFHAACSGGAARDAGHRQPPVFHAALSFAAGQGRLRQAAGCRRRLVLQGDLLPDAQGEGGGRVPWTVSHRPYHKGPLARG